MPYSIRKKGSKWVLVVKDTGKVVGEHDSKASAERQIMAIEISKHEKKG